MVYGGEDLSAGRERVRFMFKVGDCVAHPMHGAGVIDSIQEKKINGVSRQYYVLKLPVGGMVVMIPMETSSDIGVRPIVSPETAEEIIESMPTLEYEITQNWNQRYRENMLRIKSGDLREVARVIKALVSRDRNKGLSTGERKMLHAAKQILISEIVLSEGASYEEIESRIDGALS